MTAAAEQRDSGTAAAQAERPTIVSIRDASKIYKMGEVDVPALRHASLDILDGEFLVVVGPSGSGKSTLLNLIGGMDRPTSGSVVFEGKDLAHASERELTAHRRKRIGFIFQFYNLIPSLTALENVEVAAELVAEPIDPLGSLDLVGLAPRAHHFPSQLSGGEQQRVAVARALAGNPRLLLCDEPTGALDIETGRQVLALLFDLNRRLRKTVVLITHHSPIRLMADRVASIRDGAVERVEVNATPVPPEQLIL